MATQTQIIGNQVKDQSITPADLANQLYTLTASLATSASYATTASYALNGGGTGTTLTTGSEYPITSSWSISSSYAITASYALNNSSVSSLYTTVTTSSTNWITCSMDNQEQIVNITTGLLYSFTQSNMPAASNFKNITLYFNNTAATTSSLSFPATWKNLSGGWPTRISSSKSALLVLKAIDTNTVIGSWASEIY